MRKKIVVVLALAVLLSFHPVFRVSAAGTDTFILDDMGSVALNSPHGAEEGIASLQFSLKVDGANAEEVSFRFAGLSAEVQEYRYHPDSHSLNIYIAGSETLFHDNQGHLDIGRVIVLDDQKNEAEARISVVEDSLKFVYGTETKKADKVVLPDSVIINGSNEPDVPLETPPAGSGPDEKPEENPSGSGNGDQSSGSGDGDQSSGSGNGDQSSGSGSGDGSSGSGQGDGDWQNVESGSLPGAGQGSSQGTGTNTGTGGKTNSVIKPAVGTGSSGTWNIGGTEVPVTSEYYDKVRQLLLSIRSMKESDYTPESFAALQRAADEARHVLEDSSSTDEEMAAVLLELENAIGALVRKDEMTVIKPESQEETSAVEEIPENIESDEEAKGSAFPWILTMILLVVAAAGGALFFLMRYKGMIGNKKKKSDGKWRDIIDRK